MEKECRRLTDEEREIIRFCWDIKSLPAKGLQQRKYNVVLIFLTLMLFVMTGINIYFLAYSVSGNPWSPVVITIAPILLLYKYLYRDFIKIEKERIEHIGEVATNYIHKCQDFFYRLKKDPNLCQDSLELIEFYEEISKGIEKMHNNNNHNKKR